MPLLETLINSDRLFITIGKQYFFFEKFQQYFVKARKFQNRAIVILHKLFNGKFMFLMKKG